LLLFPIKDHLGYVLIFLPCLRVSYSIDCINSELIQIGKEFRHQEELLGWISIACTLVHVKSVGFLLSLNTVLNQAFLFDFFLYTEAFKQTKVTHKLLHCSSNKCLSLSRHIIPTELCITFWSLQ